MLKTSSCRRDKPTYEVQTTFVVVAASPYLQDKCFCLALVEEKAGERLWCQKKRLLILLPALTFRPSSAGAFVYALGTKRKKLVSMMMVVGTFMLIRTWTVAFEKKHPRTAGFHFWQFQAGPTSGDGVFMHSVVNRVVNVVCLQLKVVLQSLPVNYFSSFSASLASYENHGYFTLSVHP